MERRDGFDTTSSFSSDGGHHHRHHHNFNGEPYASSASYLQENLSLHLPPSWHKRQFSQCDAVDYDSSGSYFNRNPDLLLPPSWHQSQISQCATDVQPVDYGFVKLYVVGIPKTATEQVVRDVFGQFGDIIEVVIMRDKRTGLQQEICFVKYARIEQAELAIGALHGQDPFSTFGAMPPMQVKYASGERERLGINGQFHKLYVGCLNRQAMRWEIEEIFSPFGVLEEVFVVGDEFNMNRGFAFVQFASRNMAVAAIQALHGIYVMRGCNNPLIVRFADPKKPRCTDSSFTTPAPYVNESSNGRMFSNETRNAKLSHSDGGSGVFPVNPSIEKEKSTECDWSEHVSPDGDLYYYNCVTCESRWEMPGEYSLYEELDNLEQEQEESKMEALFTPEIPKAQEV